MAKKIKMLVPLHGISKGTRTTKIETEGFTGDACQKASAGLIGRLGTVDDEELKPEFYEAQTQEEHLNQGDGPAAAS